MLPEIHQEINPIKTSRDIQTGNLHRGSVGFLLWLGANPAAGLVAARQVVSQFAPSWSVVRIPVPRDPSLRSAGGMVRTGDLQGAVCAARKTLTDDPANASAVVLEAAVYEAGGWLDAAEKLYGRASKMDPSSSTKAGMERIESRRAELAVLKRHYGMAYKPGKAPAYSCE